MLLACQHDSYLTSWDAQVLDCQPNDGTGNLGTARLTAHKGHGFLLLLDDTILFPEGGGQPSDFGSINGIQVSDVWRDAQGRVLHLLPSNFTVGDKVTVEVNWERRYDHMQQHTSQHLISALAKQHLDANTVSWQLGREYCTIDFDRKLSADDLQRLEDLANEHVRNSRAVSYEFLSNKDEKEALPAAVRSRGVPEVDTVRLVHIDGLDKNTCCGTHVKNLTELQMIKFVNTEIKKGTSRLTFLAGIRVSKAVSTWAEREKHMNAVLHTEPVQHVSAAKHVADEVKTLTREKRQILKEFVEIFANKLVTETPADQAFLELHREDADMTFLQSIATLIQHHRPKLTLFLSCGNKSKGGQFLLLGPETLLSAVGPLLNSHLGGSSGGKGNKLQGKASSWANRSEVIKLLQDNLTEQLSSK
ncbi:Alanyl-tRNA editing protein Aarsd1 [Balamuthia mandrillaris]